MVDGERSILSVNEATVPPPTWGRLGGGDVADKTRSILQCIAYAHSNLDAAAQRLLLCLFPFTGVIGVDQLDNYFRHLVTLSPHLPVSHFPAVLKAAQEWGLLTPHEIDGYLRLQPVLPYFLKTQLAQEPPEVKTAIETAFRLHYSDLAAAFFKWFEAKDPQQRQTARLLTGVEYENLTTALQRCLTDQVQFFDLYAVLGLYLDSVQDHRRGIELGQSILAHMEQYPAEMRFGAAADGFLRVLGELGSRQMTLKRYDEAAASYQAAAELIEQITTADAQQKGKWQATTYHKLGMVAQAQRQWAQAAQHYQHTLAIYIEFNDRYSQASTYHQLGNVAFEQRQWAQAEQHYQHALDLTIEFNDRYEQAGTYHQLGNVAQAQQQWAQARQHYQHALTRYIEFNDHYEQAGTYHALGMVAQKQRQWTQAEQHYQHALALKIQFNDRYEQAITYGQLGLLAQAQEQWLEAARYLAQALQIFVEFQDEHYADVARDSLRRLWQAHPDEALLAVIAGVLGGTVEEVRGWLTSAAG